MLTPTSSTAPSLIPWRAGAAAGLVLVVFGGAVAWLTFDLRAQQRAQVLTREGELLHTVALFERDGAAQLAAEVGLAGDDDPLAVALETARLRGVVAVRIFDERGAFLDAVPASTDEGELAPGDRARLDQQAPVARFHPDFALERLLLNSPPEQRATLLEVNVPLPSRNATRVGHILQYWCNGAPVAAEFARLDRRLAWQAGWVFIVGGALIVGAIWWGARRLRRAHAMLRAHAEDLARANRELAQTARTSAIGAITAHLMHGLRNPLAGLEDFVAAQGVAPADAGAGEWAAARESTRRMRTIINEVHAVLRDVEHGADYVLTAGEVCAGLRERLQACCARHGVRLECRGEEAATMAAREAGLGGLVLANLAQNAIEASPRDGSVIVESAINGGAIVFTVRDRGPGLPAEVVADPFRPRRSTKPDGAGIGLAISAELARHAGGELRLVYSGPDGTSFRVQLPTVVARPERRNA